MKALDRAILLFLAAVFVLSGVDKLLHYQGFVNALRAYVIVPRGTAIFLAMPVIACELLIGAGLLARPWRRHAALAAAVLLLIFTAALGINRLYGGRAICGCWFTITLARGTLSHIAQNLIMATLAFSLWWSAREEGRPQAPSATLKLTDPI